MIGRIISHYKILEKLGTGGMGVVYKAQDNKLGRFIALKFLPPHLAIGEEEKQRFIREARAASSLDHPNICTIHEINETKDGQMYMVMAYYQGETLKDKIERSALPLPEAIRISLQIASGLEKAHDNQIIHRDIKPANIIITSDGNVKILDFGLAKLCTQKGITKTGSTLGTVAYMSPEQTRGAELDARSDLWSLGVVIYEMITGRLPFQGEYEVAIVYSINNEEPPPATKYRNELDGSLSSIIQRCLEKNIADRYQNATELVHDLTVCQLPAEQTGSGKLFAATLSKQKKRNAAKRRKWLIGASTMAILFVVSLVAYWVTSKTESQAPLSDKVFAVFPFTVHGEQKSSYLREGMIDLLYTTINGTGDLRTIDTRALLNQVKLLKKSEIDQEDAKKIARFLGAGHYILGSVFSVKDRLRCSATLYYTRGDESASTPITAEGKADNLFELVDGVTSQIFAKYSKSPADRMNKLGAMTTQSMPALKAYLEGARADRDGHFKEAQELYSRAVQLDTSFAMAWFGLAQLDFCWLMLHDEAQSSLNHAFRHSAKLSMHDRRLLDFLQFWLNGEGEKVLEIARQMVKDDQNDVIGWNTLATTSIQVCNLYGYSQQDPEIRNAFQQLLTLEPENASNYQQAVVASYFWGDLVQVDSLIAKFRRLSPNFEYGWAVTAPRAFINGDRALQQKILSEASGQDDWNISNGTQICAVIGKDFNDTVPMARELLNRSRPLYIQATGYLTLAVLEMSRGRWSSAMTKLDSLDTIYPEYSQVFRGIYSPVYFCHTPADQRAAGWNYESPQKNLQPGRVVPKGDFAEIPSLLPQIQLYSRGLYHFFQGDCSQTISFSRALIASKLPIEVASLVRLWAVTLQALVDGQGNRSAAALAVLENEPIRIRFPLFWNALYSTAFCRYLRAEQLNRLGRYEEALKWYGALAETYFFDLPYRAPAALKRAGIYETLNQPEKAIREYERFLYIWRDCGPEFQHITAEAENRVKALKRKE